MITEYFTTEELERELAQDYYELQNYLINRKFKLIHQLIRQRKKIIERLLPWISKNNNKWYYTELMLNEHKGVTDTLHEMKFCVYKFNGKTRVTSVLQDVAEKEGVLSFSHYSYHLLNRLKERLNWNLTMEKTTLKFMREFKEGTTVNMTEKYKDGSFPIYRTTNFGLMLGLREYDYLNHYLFTTIISTEMLKGDQKALGQMILENMEKILKDCPKETLERHKKKFLYVLKKFNVDSIPK